MTNLNKTLILCALLVIGNCKTYYFIKEEAIADKPLAISNTKKIGLVGYNFYTGYYLNSKVDFNLDIKYCSKFGLKELRLGVVKQEYFLGVPFYIGPYFIDQSQDLKKYSAIGFPIEESQKSINENKIPQENILQFICNYLAETDISGIQELNSIFKSGARNRKELLRKDPTVDYYLVCINGPTFKENTYKGNWIEIPTSIISTLTLGTFPVVTNLNSYSKFYLYDKHFKLLNSEIIDKDYWSISAWWLLTAKSDSDLTEISFYISNIKAYNKKLPSILKSLYKEITE